MKKLVLVVSAIATAVASQAATVNWSVSSLQDASGNALNGGYAYVFTTKGANATTVAALTAALEAATDAKSFQSALSGFTYMTALSGAVSGGSQGVSDVLISASGLTPNTSNTKLFALITDTATITDDTNWYVTGLSGGAKTGASDTALGAANFTVPDTGSHTAGNWKAVAAPEPTSGLLMLLGMAGLALRRKRA